MPESDPYTWPTYGSVTTRKLSLLKYNSEFLLEFYIPDNLREHLQHPKIFDFLYYYYYDLLASTDDSRNKTPPPPYPPLPLPQLLFHVTPTLKKANDLQITNGRFKVILNTLNTILLLSLHQKNKKSIKRCLRVKN